MAADARGPRHRAAGHRQDARGEAARARRDRRHPGRREAARQVPDRADLGHAPAGLRPQARAAALRRARRRLAGGAARGGRGAARSASCAGSARKVEEKLLRDAGRARGGRRAGAADPALAGDTDRRADRRRAARAPGARPVEVAGSLRRQADSVKDLDIIATAERPGGAGARRWASWRWSSRCSTPRRRRRARHDALGHEGRPARSSSPTSSATSCSTSRAPRRTTCALREAAVRRGLHVSEYGILDDATGETLRCATEEEVYERLGLRVDPAGAARGARRARGGAAKRAGLPQLIDARATCAATCTATRRCPTGARRSSRWPRRRAAAGSSTWRSPTTRPRTGSATTSRRRRWRRGSRRSRALNERLDGFDGAGRHRGQHPPRRLARLPRRAARAASTG